MGTCGGGPKLGPSPFFERDPILKITPVFGFWKHSGSALRIRVLGLEVWLVKLPYKFDGQHRPFGSCIEFSRLF